MRTRKLNPNIERTIKRRKEYILKSKEESNFISNLKLEVKKIDTYLDNNRLNEVVEENLLNARNSIINTIINKEKDSGLLKALETSKFIRTPIATL